MAGGSGTWDSTKINRDIADYETFGGTYQGMALFSPSQIESLSGFWISESTYGDRGMTITFTKEVTLTSFKITTRPGNTLALKDYVGVALGVDGNEIAKTPDPFVATEILNLLDYRVNQGGI